MDNNTSSSINIIAKNPKPSSPQPVYVRYESNVDTAMHQLQSEIKLILDEIIQSEKDEYTLIVKQLESARVYGINFPGSNAIAVAKAYKKALVAGLWKGAKGLVAFAWDLLKGTGKVMYELALRTNPITAPGRFKQDLITLKASHQSLERFLDKDLETYAVLMNDEQTQEILVQFSKDYINAQHSIEITEGGGEIAFDIVLAIVTFGGGVVANVRHLKNINRLKPLFIKIVALIKLRTIYKKAPAAKIEIDIIADDIVKKHGGTVAKAPIKSKERALEKVLTVYDGDARRINDLARNTVVVQESKIKVIIANLKTRGANLRVIDGSRDPLGYSGVNSTIKTKSGILGEIQVNTPAMIYAKEPEALARVILGNKVYDRVASKTGGVKGGKGHKYYEQWRSLDIDDPGRESIETQSKVYYESIRRSTHAN